VVGDCSAHQGDVLHSWRGCLQRAVLVLTKCAPAASAGAQPRIFWSWSS
jgi:hypothetical protein